jgi:hypothetical protein
VTTTIKKSFIALCAILLLVISILSAMQIEVVDANPAPLPPKFTVESPQNNTVIYNTDSAKISVKLETVSVFDYYYSVDKPRTTFPYGKIPLNLTITSEKPLTHEKTHQCNIQLHNLTDGQHSVTLYYSYYDSIIPDWEHILPVATIVFSIDNLVTPSPKPTPTVPEFPTALTITFLIMVAVAFAVVSRRKHLTES